jgi:hypothetical protein
VNSHKRQQIINAIFQLHLMHSFAIVLLVPLTNSYSQRGHTACEVNKRFERSDSGPGERNVKLIAQTSFLFVMLASLNAVSFAQSKEQNINVTVRPSQTVEERVTDSIKEKELREAAEEKLAAEKSARVTATNPRTLLSRAQTVFVTSGTSFFEPVQLQNALRKRSEFEAWDMAILDGWDKQKIADITIEVDRPLFTYTFTYTITDRGTGLLLASGKLTAFDGNDASPLLAGRIIGDITKAREQTKGK